METDLDFIKQLRVRRLRSLPYKSQEEFSWFKEGSRAFVKVPKTRAKATAILGEISPFGVVNISVRRS
jgi:hypothetical protein